MVLDLTSDQLLKCSIIPVIRSRSEMLDHYAARPLKASAALVLVCCNSLALRRSGAPALGL